MIPAVSLYPRIASVIDRTPQPPDMNHIARALGLERERISHPMRCMRKEELIEAVPISGPHGGSRGWTLTAKGRALLKGYKPLPTDVVPTGKLDATALMDALRMPRYAPPLPPDAIVRVVEEL